MVRRQRCLWVGATYGGDCSAHFTGEHRTRQVWPSVPALVRAVSAQPSQRAATVAISQSLELLESGYRGIVRLLRDAGPDILCWQGASVGLVLDPHH